MAASRRARRSGSRKFTLAFLSLLGAAAAAYTGTRGQTLTPLYVSMGLSVIAFVLAIAAAIRD